MSVHLTLWTTIVAATRQISVKLDNWRITWESIIPNSKLNTCLQLHVGQQYYKGKVLSFPWQQLLCKRVKMLRYITLPTLLQKENE
jgi:hypothetical protein